MPLFGAAVAGSSTRRQTLPLVVVVVVFVVVEVAVPVEAGVGRPRGR